MLRKLIKNKKAQNTAEYAILISLVVAGIIAMQTYAQRALQAKVRDASVYLSDVGDGTDGGLTLDTSAQYEPYYLKSSYDVDRKDTSVQDLDTNHVITKFDQGRNRGIGGYQASTYNQEDPGSAVGL